MKEGYIYDFISGQEIRATPEEVEAVQIFSKQLVEDYNYPKEHIQTRPQFRVKTRPSDTKREYPVDIAIFSNEQKQENNIYIIVECKRKNRADGKTQLQDYLRLSKAFLGVWFNGKERIFLRKIEESGKIEFEEIPNIPKYKQRLEDIGKFKRKELKSTHNLKIIFKTIRNYLAANAVGTTRDEILAQQLINIIFCKIYDELFTRQDDILSFRCGLKENIVDVRNRLVDIFKKVKEKYKNILESKDEIGLDDKSIAYVVGELQNYCLMQTERDVIADVFETFIGKALKGEQGQFFTPRNVVRMIVNILDPSEKDIIIDPACGSGGFLIEALKYVWNKIDENSYSYSWSLDNREKNKYKIADENFRGIDKDSFLSKVTKVYMTLIGDGESGIFCDDSLEKPQNWKEETRQKVKIGNFDIVITNPPFGAKLPVSGEKKLTQFQLAKDKNDNVKKKVSPQILFIERCLHFLKEGGRMAIILPDSIYGNKSLSYIREWLLLQGRIIAILDMPIETFMPNTATKTSILIFQKLSKEKISDDYPVFMSVAETCGHDRRGNETYDDQIKEIFPEYQSWSINPDNYKSKKNYFSVNSNSFISYDLWLAKYLFPKFISPLKKLNKFPLIKLGDILNFEKGVEVGSKNYIPFMFKRSNDVPYIRTSDLANYTINNTSDLYISKPLFKENNLHFKEKDILFTKDGKIGIVAIVSKQKEFLISSGIVKCSFKENIIENIKLEYKIIINPEYIFSLLINREIGFYQSIRRTVVAATIPHLNLDRLNDLEIPLFNQENINIITSEVQRMMTLESEKFDSINKIQNVIANIF